MQKKKIKTKRQDKQKSKQKSAKDPADGKSVALTSFGRFDC